MYHHSLDSRHSGIKGNEQFDKLAKSIANNELKESKLRHSTYQDTIKTIRISIVTKCSRKWKIQETRLNEIKLSTEPWKNTI